MRANNLSWRLAARHILLYLNTFDIGVQGVFKEQIHHALGRPCLTSSICILQQPTLRIATTKSLNMVARDEFYFNLASSRVGLQLLLIFVKYASFNQIFPAVNFLQEVVRKISFIRSTWGQHIFPPRREVVK